jgi:hypothetical protein
MDKVGGREKERETFPLPHAISGSKDSKWYFTICGLKFSWDGRILSTRILATLTIR